MPKLYSFREPRKRLKKHDERIIYHPDINGTPRSFPVKCHGESTELRKGVISAIVRRFELPKDVL